MMPLEMMPVGANGENAAALQAPTTSRVIRNAGILTRPAISHSYRSHKCAACDVARADSGQEVGK